MINSQRHDSTIFSVPVRWSIRVLAWLAFFIASYLAWKAATGAAVAGCDAGSGTGCDAVLSSRWSMWLFIPVSVAGLACYASLAGFSSLIGLTGPRESRWIDALVVMLSVAAAGASLWFIAVQAIAVREFCPYCMVVDTCGIVLGVLAVWSVFQSSSVAGAEPVVASSTAALRTTIPGVGRVAPLQFGQKPQRPPFELAFGGAALMLVLLIGGQTLAPARMYLTAKPALDQPINMAGASHADTSLADATNSGQTHVVNRVTTDGENSEHAADATANAEAPSANGGAPPAANGTAENGSSTASSNGGSKRHRPVSFLGGKLTLDTYEHPILGDPEAPHVVVELVSYDCPHCRKMHPLVQRSQRRYGNQVAVLILPVPLEMKCNRLVTDPKASHPGACTTARMALAVARIKPAAFRAFHDFLMEDVDKPPTQAKAVGKAYNMVDTTKLSELTSGSALNKQIAENIDLFATLQQQYAGTNKSIGLPIQILGDEIMSGSVENDEDVYKAWEKNFGVKPL